MSVGSKSDSPSPEDSSELSALRRKLRRARAARDEAERIGENATRRLFLANKELSDLNKELAELDEAKRRFYTNVSHELRTPLTLILGFLKSAQRRLTDGDEVVRADLQAAQRNAAALLREINDLLEVARVESGRLVLSAAPVDLVELVRDVTANFAPPSRAELRRRLVVKVPAEPCVVHLDIAHARKILFNLLSNAFKFTDDERGLVTVRVCDTDPERVQLEVEDNGIGIGEEDLAEVFERFHRSAQSSRKYVGTGIGLTLVKELTELHGGTVAVRSRIGEGSCFIVTFRRGREHLSDDQVCEAPASSAADDLAPPPESDLAPLPADSPTTEKAPNPDTAPDTAPDILVVEDHRDLRDYLVRLLSSYRVRSSKDGAQALDEIKRRVPDLIVSDVMMPNVDGFELCAAVKSDPATSHVPVILLTAQAGLTPKLHGLEVRADDYLTKPFEEEELLARVSNLLVIHRQAVELREMNTRLQEEVLEQADALRRRGRLQRFLPPQVVNEILQEDAGAALKRRRRRVAVLCAELHGFDDLADCLEPEDLTALFGRFHTLTVETVFSAGGTIASLCDGKLQAVFGAPVALSEEEAALAAVRVARALDEKISALAAMWRDYDAKHPLAARGGIDVGYATVGAFGDGEWASFAVVGGPAVRAGRLCSCATAGQILISGRVARHTKAHEALEGPRVVETDTWSQEVWWLRAKETVTKLEKARAIETAATASPAIEPPSSAQELSAQLSPRPVASTIESGEVLSDRYVIERKLGHGGMGTVYEVTDRLLDQRVALKVLYKQKGMEDDRVLERLRREVRLARLVTHTNVCRVFDLQVLDGHACVTMELVRGHSLRALLYAGTVSPAQALDWALQLCQGLAAAHTCGIVHRDLKPENTLCEDGGRLVIVDFGIARPASGVEPQTGSVAGTLDYMAPEQLREGSKPDARSDIYSLGVLLFELFTGELPFTGSDQLVRATARLVDEPRDPATIVPTIDPTVRAVILRCLRRDMDKRVQRVTDVHASLSLVSPLSTGEACTAKGHKDAV